jgi:hypothetical protein
LITYSRVARCRRGPQPGLFAGKALVGERQLQIAFVIRCAPERAGIGTGIRPREIGANQAEDVTNVDGSGVDAEAEGDAGYRSLSFEPRSGRCHDGDADNKKTRRRSSGPQNPDRFRRFG